MRFRSGILLLEHPDRPGERIISLGLKLVNHPGILRKFQPLTSSPLAKKLAEAPQVHASKTRFIELEESFAASGAGPSG